MAKPTPDTLAKAEASQTAAVEAIEAALHRMDRLGAFEGQLALADSAVRLAKLGPPLADDDKERLKTVRRYFIATVHSIDAAMGRRPEDLARWQDVRAGFVGLVRNIDRERGARPWDGSTKPSTGRRHTAPSAPERARRDFGQAIRQLREL